MATSDSFICVKCRQPLVNAMVCGCLAKPDASGPKEACEEYQEDCVCDSHAPAPPRDEADVVERDEALRKLLTHVEAVHPSRTQVVKYAMRVTWDEAVRVAHAAGRAMERKRLGPWLHHNKLCGERADEYVYCICGLDDAKGDKENRDAFGVGLAQPKERGE